jgi:hypothetical protein
VAQVNAPPEGSRLLRVLKAAAMGIGAGLLGAAIWYAIRVGAHLQIGLVAVLVGFMVGKSVRKGSGGRGGRGYQVMAVLITYGCIAANYMPDVVQAMADGFHKHKQTAAQVQSSTAPSTQSAIADGSQNSSTGAVSSTTAAKPLHQRTLARTIIGATLAVVLVFTFSLAVPFLDGNVIGLLIIGFALWEAWKFNAPRRLAITGPYQVGANAALPISPGTDGVIV